MPGRLFVPLTALLLAGCMEQPKPNPLPRTASVYTRIGGEEKLVALVETFAEKVEAARGVSRPVKAALAGPDAEEVKRRLVERLGAALGGPYPKADGNVFVAALKGHVEAPLSAEDRKALSDLFEATLREANLGERLLADVNKALAGATGGGEG